MLIYHPAYDAYHCIFRMLSIVEHVRGLEIDKARLLDFYLMFPSAVSEIRLPSNLKEARKLARTFSNVYHDPISVASTFRDMAEIQLAALKCIAASGLIDAKKLAAGLVERTSLAMPPEILSKISGFLAQRDPLAGIILFGLGALPLRGDDGLKHRTSLMEYRYDVA
ncbi:ABC-three component system middle component 5 [Variovorax sp. tm]|uniref:ABC-three component system middle component 5 n=1 Tax=Variovorax atrisoli TaxID=3394203 RepID=UPI003A7F9D1A